MKPETSVRNRLTTARDVAAMAGVSQSAVSRCFTPGASVAPATRARVLGAADRLGYRPNLIARGLITRRTGMVGVAMGNLANHVYPTMLQMLSNQLQARGMSVLLLSAPRYGMADPELSQVLRYQVDALVLAATTLSSELADECRAAGVPVILFNRVGGSGGASSVTGSNIQGGREIAELAALGGHRRPAFIAGPDDASTSQDREAGFAEGLAAHGLPPALRAAGHYDPVRAAEAMACLLRRPDRPDFVFCASDHMAIAAVDTARHVFGLRVPEDVSIAGFDDAPPASWPSYALTTYALPIQPMVDATLALLTEQWADPDAPVRQVVVPGSLVVRDTCRLTAKMETVSCPK